MTDPIDDQPLFPIRTVSSLTGVNPVTLRAWERRYGLIKPKRTPKGHRLYGEADVARVKEILALLDRGIPVGRVRAMLDAGERADSLREGIAMSTANSAETMPSSDGLGDPFADPWAPYLRRMREAIARFNDQALEATYNDALSLYPLELVTRLLLRPMLDELRQRSAEDALALAERQFFHSYLRGKLELRFRHQSSQSRGPRLLFAGLPGERSDIELLLLALSVQAAGFSVVMLGGGTPLEPLPLAAERAEAAGVVIHASDSQPPAVRGTHLPALAASLNVPLMIAGPLAQQPGEALQQTDCLLLNESAQAAVQQLRDRLGVA